MKKWITVCFLVISLHISPVLADASSELQKRLNKINSFHAHFVQTVISTDGDIIQKNDGYLWIKRPNLFNWHMITPDESWLISDGTNLWFYNPFIAQVTIMLLNNIMNDTLFLLLTGNDPQNWKKYYITQNGNNFLLTPIHNKDNVKKFSITIRFDGTVQQFTEIEQDGKMSLYQLHGQKNNHIDDNKFKFIPPKDVTIDDQRSSSGKTI
ncbi:MAG: outer membrane lipoprotein chaperone LolA [Candidatus Arsenophonus melophagi]|nr:outer membrane lipoprotein chaperone LolA [Candidatus Arsenophonus melophagi]